MKKLISAILSIALFAFVAISCQPVEPDPKPAPEPTPAPAPVPEPEPAPEVSAIKTIAITPAELTLAVGEEATLTVATDPAGYEGELFLKKASKGNEIECSLSGTTIRVKATHKLLHPYKIACASQKNHSIKSNIVNIITVDAKD